MANELTPKEEWEAARATAVHFDTILMQIRTFGLPLIATAIGAGAAIGTTVQRIDTSPTVIAGLCITLGILLLASPLALTGHLSKVQRLREGPLEFAFLYLVAGALLVWGIWIAVDQPPPFLFSALVLIFGPLLLIPIYLLDRFYYSCLLLGAIERAKELEPLTQGSLTRVISDYAPDWAFKVLPMLFYALPLLLLLNIGLATIAFASESGATCQVTITTAIEDGVVRLVSELPPEVASECLE